MIIIDDSKFVTPVDAFQWMLEYNIAGVWGTFLYYFNDLCRY